MQHWSPVMLHNSTSETLLGKLDCGALVSSGWPDQPAVPGQVKRLRALSGVWLRELEDRYLPGHPSGYQTLRSQPGLRQCGVCLFTCCFFTTLYYWQLLSFKLLYSIFFFQLWAFMFSVNTVGPETLFSHHRKRLCRHLSNQKLWMDPTSTSASVAKRNVTLEK